MLAQVELWGHLHTGWWHSHIDRSTQASTQHPERCCCALQAHSRMAVSRRRPGTCLVVARVWHAGRQVRGQVEGVLHDRQVSYGVRQRQWTAISASGRMTRGGGAPAGAGGRAAPALPRRRAWPLAAAQVPGRLLRHCRWRPWPPAAREGREARGGAGSDRRSAGVGPGVF